MAMRRCYSTKTIEEIQAELEQKGPEYWKYLLTRALQDKSLDVIEHFCLTVIIDGLSDARAGELSRRFQHVRLLSLQDESWLLSLNARTLIEVWRGGAETDLADAIVSELQRKGVSPILSELAFGGKTVAS